MDYSGIMKSWKLIYVFQKKALCATNRAPTENRYEEALWISGSQAKVAMETVGT